MRIFTLILFVFLSSMSLAAVQTETHIYILSRHENKILIVDRKTGDEKVLEVGKNPTSFLINAEMGYVVNRDSPYLTVVCLKEQKVVGKIPLNTEPFHMTIHGNKGYVSCSGAYSLEVIDLCQNKREGYINLSAGIQGMVVYKNYGYVPCSESNTVWAINLLTNKTIRPIAVYRNPCHIKIYGSKGYVIGSASSLQVLNLETQEVIDSIHLKSCFYDFVIQGKMGYGLEWGWGNYGRIVEIDLETHKILRSIEIGAKPVSLNFYKNKGYILGRNSNKLIVIDLMTFEVLKELELPSDAMSMTIHKGTGFVCFKNEVQSVDLRKDIFIQIYYDPPYHFMHDVAFSDTHMYVGVRRHVELPFRLFDYPYLGIEGPLYGDADLAFDRFQRAWKYSDLLYIIRHFKEALALGHSKANAVAAYAFLFSLWGADDNNEDRWFFEFFKCADKKYFSKLILTNGTCLWEEQDLIEEITANLNKLSERERFQIFSGTD